ncbi:hypothetical protein [Clostridium gasigenes]|uniref:hypothetical protein n=1 Tax=Clostridium gasigenes TaxID=94869 RepID=UPI001C0BCA03|nr:hypothetical protein [Clostridium gasigenes]MBU3105074.1 hypothetical protein [Clostridium gasigenes]
MEFLKVIFIEMLKRQNEILRESNALLKAHFKAIKVVASTVISLPEHLKSTFRWTGGSSSNSAVKIQLEYDLLTGSFLGCDIFEGVSNDIEYLPTLQQNIEAKELHLKLYDFLVYFKTDIL